MQNLKKMRTVKGMDDSLRLQIIEEHLDGASKYSLVRKYNLKDPQIIRNWMRIFGMEDRINPVPESFMHKEDPLKASEELKRLRLENKRLKTELAQSELRAKAYNKMIDVAEDMFKIPIRKKPGAKQS